MKSFIFLLLLTSIAQEDDRCVKADSSDSFTRGLELATKLDTKIKALWNHWLDIYADKLETWKSLALNNTGLIKKYAPETFAELQGYAAHPDFNLTQMLMINYQWELTVLSGNLEIGHCTSFAVNSFVTEDGSLISGQTDDENPNSVLDGKYDVILNIKTNETQILTFTHPGMPGYFGMNSNGLTAINTYIDTGDHSATGLPTTIIMREILSKKTVREALDWLKSIPINICNHFGLATPEEGIYDVEICPHHWGVYQISEGEIFHTNHVIYDPYLMSKDMVLDPTTYGRLNAIKEGVQNNTGHITVEKMKEIMLNPIITRSETLVDLIYHNDSLHALFRNEHNWRTYKFD